MMVSKEFKIYPAFPGYEHPKVEVPRNSGTLEYHITGIGILLVKSALKNNIMEKKRQ
jgi:hypothetical protein